MKFKIGDYVKYTGPVTGLSYGKIVGYVPGGSYRIMCDAGKFSGKEIGGSDSMLELVRGHGACPMVLEIKENENARNG